MDPHEVQRSPVDRQVGRRRNDVDMLALKQHSIAGLQYFHLGVAGQQLDHHAGMGRVKMRDQDESHPAIRR